MRGQVSHVSETSPATDESELDQARRVARGRLHRWGGEELVREMTALFLADTPKRLAIAGICALSGDWKGVVGAVHALRGSSAQLGARRMQVVCAEIEHLVTRGATSDVAPLLDALEEEYDRFRACLDAERMTAEVSP